MSYSYKIPIGPFDKVLSASAVRTIGDARYLMLDASNDPVTGALQLNNTFTVGANTAGRDVKFFGATDGRYFEWDESANGVAINGTFNVKVGTSNRVYIQELGGFGGVAIGEQSEAGPLSAAFGAQAGRTYGAATFNLFLGYQSGGMNVSGGAGGGNVGLGAQTMGRGTTGQSNTVIGNVAGNNITTGSDNIIIGGQAGNQLTIGARNLIIGSGLQADTVDQTAQLKIGSGITNHSTLLEGQMAVGSERIGVPLDNAPFYLGAAGTADSYLMFDTANLDIFSDGDIDFLADGFNFNNSIYAMTNISVGTASPSASFKGTGDIYATSGIKAMEGLFSEAGVYGAGLEVQDNNAAVIYHNIATGTATLTATTQIIYDPEADFGNESPTPVAVEMFLRCIGGTPDYTGATGEIVEVIDATHIRVSFGTAGGDTIQDGTGMRFVIYDTPRAFIGDNGDFRFTVGVNEDASFKVCADASANEHAIDFCITSAVDGNAGIELDYDPHTFSDCSALEINYDATAFATPDKIGTVLDVIIDNAGATDGALHAMDVAVADTSNTDIEVSAVSTHPGVDVIHQHAGEATAFPTAFEYDDSGTSYSDVTTALGSAGTDVTLFEEDDDCLYVGALTKYDAIEVILATTADPTIRPRFYFVEGDGTESAFTPADDTDGFQTNGLIRFDSANLVDWGGRTINEITGEGDNVVDYYWIKIRRRKNNMSTLPIEDTIKFIVGTEYEWDSEGNVTIKTLTVGGYTLPAADGTNGQWLITNGAGVLSWDGP